MVGVLDFWAGCAALGGAPWLLARGARWRGGTRAPGVPWLRGRAKLARTAPALLRHRPAEHSTAQHRRGREPSWNTKATATRRRWSAEPSGGRHRGTNPVSWNRGPKHRSCPLPPGLRGGPTRLAPRPRQSRPLHSSVKACVAFPSRTRRARTNLKILHPAFYPFLAALSADLGAPPASTPRAMSNKSFTDQEDAWLCQLISTNPALYDSKLAEYKNRTIRDKTWEEIGKTLYRSGKSY